MNHNLEEKLSALYDGELDTNEVDEILDALEKDTNLQKKLSQYALVSSSINNSNNIQSIHSKKKSISYELLVFKCNHSSSYGAPNFCCN